MNYLDENYIDEIALQISRACGDYSMQDPSMRRLWRLYALLVLTTGTATTNENIHDAWSVWMLEIDPTHRSLLPFKDLSRAVQELDSKYRDVVRHMATAVVGAF